MSGYEVTEGEDSRLSMIVMSPVYSFFSVQVTKKMLEFCVLIN